MEPKLLRRSSWWWREEREEGVTVTRFGRLKAHPMLIALALVVVGGVMAGGAIASATTAPKGVPWPAVKSKVFIYVDTEAAANEGVLGDCEQANLFQPGQTVLFRASAQLAKTGVTLQPAQIRTFKVLIPGQAAIPLVYAEHDYGVVPGKKPGYYWTGVWKIPASYPLGIVNFRVNVLTRTKPAISANWTQIPIVASSLTVVPAAATTTTTTTVAAG